MLITPINLRRLPDIGVSEASGYCFQHPLRLLLQLACPHRSEADILLNPGNGRLAAARQVMVSRALAGCLGIPLIRARMPA